jgi:hypothetical protein
MVLADRAGLEPAVAELTARCIASFATGQHDGARGRTRTGGLRFRKPLLCPLSYAREIGCPGRTRTYVSRFRAGHLGRWMTGQWPT